MQKKPAIGRLLRSGSAGFVVGMRVSDWDTPAFGSLVRIPLANNYEIYGLIYDIHITDDGLVRQLITAGDVEAAIIADNRENRNAPIEVSVVSIGYADNGVIRHLLPPRPPLSLESIYLCSGEELCAFTAAGKFGYFRHVLRAADVPTGELLAAHIEGTQKAQASAGNPGWGEAAARELIVLLRDDYPTLMAVLSALGDTTQYQEK